MPLTRTGKIDRNQLPAPELEPDEPSAPPQTAVEEKLGGIWREVLGLVGIGRRDDFFELGGHSLAAMQVTARVWRDFGVDLPLHVVFERPALADMAAYVDALVVSTPEPEAAACASVPQS